MSGTGPTTLTPATSRRPGRVYGRRRRPSRKAWVGILLLALVLAIVGVGLWLSSTSQDELPPDVTIAGVAVGGMSVDDARAALEREASRRLRQPVTLVVGTQTIDASWADLGARPLIDDAIDDAQASRGRWSTLVARLGLGSTETIELAFEPASDRLDAFVAGVAEQVESRPAAAAVRVEQGAIVVDDAVEGARLAIDETRAILEKLPTRAELPLTRIVPRISTADAERARSQALALLADPPTVVHRETRFQLQPSPLQRALVFESRRAQGDVVVSLDPQILARPLRQAFRAAEQPARNASFVLEGDRVRILPSRRGRELAVDRTVAGIDLDAPPSEVPARFAIAIPELTTSGAKALAIVRPVAEFTTEYPCCEPRVTNIQRAAEILDGMVILPDQSFSLNEALGKRTKKRGFVPAPAIYDGRLREDVGGGISQIATTLYNAAFFAGLELIQHTPHQFSISRYPMGREATVSWGGPELIFRNDWQAGALLQVVAGDTSITVRVFSSKLGRRVTTETSDPYDFVAPEVIRVANPDLPAGTEEVVQESGDQGFSVDYTREVFRGDERIRNERFHVDYDAKNAIVEYGTG